MATATRKNIEQQMDTSNVNFFGNPQVTFKINYGAVSPSGSALGYTNVDYGIKKNKSEELLGSLVSIQSKEFKTESVWRVEDLKAQEYRDKREAKYETEVIKYLKDFSAIFIDMNKHLANMDQIDFGLNRRNATAVGTARGGPSGRSSIAGAVTRPGAIAGIAAKPGNLFVAPPGVAGGARTAPGIAARVLGAAKGAGKVGIAAGAAYGLFEAGKWASGYINSSDPKFKETVDATMEAATPILQNALTGMFLGSFLGPFGMLVGAAGGVVATTLQGQLEPFTANASKLLEQINVGTFVTRQIENLGKLLSDWYKAAEDSISNWFSNSAYKFIPGTDITNPPVQKPPALPAPVQPTPKSNGWSIWNFVPSVETKVNTYALGGIVNSPAYVGTSASSNRPAIAGEAGPEAVLPLRRDASGNLGVIPIVSSTQPLNATFSGATQIRIINDNVDLKTSRVVIPGVDSLVGGAGNDTLGGGTAAQANNSFRFFPTSSQSSLGSLDVNDPNYFDNINSLNPQDQGAAIFLGGAKWALSNAGAAISTIKKPAIPSRDRTNFPGGANTELRAIYDTNDLGDAIKTMYARDRLGTEMQDARARMNFNTDPTGQEGILGLRGYKGRGGKRNKSHWYDTFLSNASWSRFGYEFSRMMGKELGEADIPEYYDIMSTRRYSNDYAEGLRKAAAVLRLQERKNEREAAANVFGIKGSVNEVATVNDKKDTSTIFQIEGAKAVEAKGNEVKLSLGFDGQVGVTALGARAVRAGITNVNQKQAPGSKDDAFERDADGNIIGLKSSLKPTDTGTSSESSGTGFGSTLVGRIFGKFTDPESWKMTVGDPLGSLERAFDISGSFERGLNKEIKRQEELMKAEERRRRGLPGGSGEAATQNVNIFFGVDPTGKATLSLTADGNGIQSVNVNGNSSAGVFGSSTVAGGAGSDKLSTLNLSEDDLRQLAIMALYEGPGTDEGLLADFRAITNRFAIANSTGTPGTFGAKSGSIADILRAPGQFSPYSEHGEKMFTNPKDSEARIAEVIKLFKDRGLAVDADLTQGSAFFQNPVASDASKVWKGKINYTAGTGNPNISHIYYNTDGTPKLNPYRIVVGRSTSSFVGPTAGIATGTAAATGYISGSGDDTLSAGGTGTDPFNIAASDREKIEAILFAKGPLPPGAGADIDQTVLYNYFDNLPLSTLNEHLRKDWLPIYFKKVIKAVIRTKEISATPSSGVASAGTSLSPAASLGPMAGVSNDIDNLVGSVTGFIGSGMASVNAGISSLFGGSPQVAKNEAEKKEQEAKAQNSAILAATQKTAEASTLTLTQLGSIASNTATSASGIQQSSSVIKEAEQEAKEQPGYTPTQATATAAAGTMLAPLVTGKTEGGLNLAGIFGASGDGEGKPPEASDNKKMAAFFDSLAPAAELAGRGRWKEAASLVGKTYLPANLSGALNYGMQKNWGKAVASLFENKGIGGAIGNLIYGATNNDWVGGVAGAVGSLFQGTFIGGVANLVGAIFGKKEKTPEQKAAAAYDRLLNEQTYSNFLGYAADEPMYNQAFLGAIPIPGRSLLSVTNRGANDTYSGSSYSGYGSGYDYLGQTTSSLDKGKNNVNVNLTFKNNTTTGSTSVDLSRSFGDGGDYSTSSSAGTTSSISSGVSTGLSAIGNVRDTISNTLGSALSAVGDLVSGVGGVLGTNFGTTGSDLAISVADLASGAYSGLVDQVAGIPDNISNSIAGIPGTIAGKVEAFTDSISQGNISEAFGLSDITTEDVAGAVASFGLSSVIGGPIGAVAGAIAKGAITGNIDIAGTIGSLTGAAIGMAIGGPLGAALGAWAGKAIAHAITGEKSIDPEAAAAISEAAMTGAGVAIDTTGLTSSVTDLGLDLEGVMGTTGMVDMGSMSNLDPNNIGLDIGSLNELDTALSNATTLSPSINTNGVFGVNATSDSSRSAKSATASVSKGSFGWGNAYGQVDTKGPPGSAIDVSHTTLGRALASFLGLKPANPMTNGKISPGSGSMGDKSKSGNTEGTGDAKGPGGHEASTDGEGHASASKSKDGVKGGAPDGDGHGGGNGHGGGYGGLGHDRDTMAVGGFITEPVEFTSVENTGYSGTIAEEAPEAILPLARDHQGRLGVNMINANMDSGSSDNSAVLNAVLRMEKVFNNLAAMLKPDSVTNTTNKNSKANTNVIVANNGGSKNSIRIDAIPYFHQEMGLVLINSALF